MICLKFQKKFIFFSLFICLFGIPNAASAQYRKSWGSLGLNLQPYFDPAPPGVPTNASLDFQEWASIRVDLGFKKEYAVISPELYYVGKGSRVPYVQTNGGGQQSGILDATMLGAACPIGLSWVNSKGTGVRFSGGLYGEVALFASFHDRNNAITSVQFENFAQRFDIGHMLAAHFLAGGDLELRLCLMQGWGDKLFSAPTGSNIEGKWGGRFQAIVLTAAYGF